MIQKMIAKLKNALKAAKDNAGFTLVEMIVVLAVISVVLGAAAWGVAGWVSHFEYISSEEKARTIYLAAQSALSAEESRGTLDDYIAKLRKDMAGDGTNSTIFTQKEVDPEKTYENENPDLKKTDFNIPYEKDNEGNEHEYGYLSVKQGDYASNVNSPLFGLLNNYITDKEALNGSIVIEFDLTAGKVYSVFYSAWATEIDYSTSGESAVRAPFYIYYENETHDARREAERTSCTVGYYASNQVNVITLDTGVPLNVVEKTLHNKETLYLDVNSDSELNDTDTAFEISIWKKGNASSGNGNGGSAFNSLIPTAYAEGEPDVKVCTFTVEKGLLLTCGQSRVDKLKVTFADSFAYPDGSKEREMDFIVSCKKSEAPDELSKDEAERRDVLSIMLDAMTTSQSYATYEKQDDKLKKTDSNSYSITRLIGCDPSDIYAEVSAVPGTGAALAYAPGPSDNSNVENALFATKADDDTDRANPDLFKIEKNRHLSNIRYLEEFVEDSDQYTYRLIDDINYDDAIVYDTLNAFPDPDDPKVTEKHGFPEIYMLNEKSIFDGAGRLIANLSLDNGSAVSYERDAEGKVDTTGDIKNIAKTLGIFGTNRGEIKEIIFSNVKAELKSAMTAASSDKAIYGDSVEAAGIVSGRNEGKLRELYFDKDCGINAEVFASVSSDIDEAKAAGVDITKASEKKDIYKRYACGVGMVSGTSMLQGGFVFDRIRTAGQVTGHINGPGSTVYETPAVSSTADRAAIFDDVDEKEPGFTNADKYTYGVGGVFGYVFGKYVGLPKHLGIGVYETKEEAAKAGVPASVEGLKEKSVEEGGYISMTKKDPVTDENGKVTDYTETNEDLFEGWNNESIVNKAKVSGGSFTGGIVGNIFVNGLEIDDSKRVDTKGDYIIPDDAVPQLVNCHNYGDTDGDDFVGGIVGVNGVDSYIYDCQSFGKPSANEDDGSGIGGGVSSGITSENFGFIKNCNIDRAEADADSEGKAYVPVIKGNMLVAGAITSVNHEHCVIEDCSTALKDISSTDKITIIGDNMDTFGYLVGNNYGVVKGGRSGDYLGYDSNRTKMIIGGAVGVNYSVVKNVDVTFDFVDSGSAEVIGGIVGENRGLVTDCNFGGSIDKQTGAMSKSMKIGGIAGRNYYDSANTYITDAEKKALIENCYLIGGSFKVKGVCGYTDTSSEAKRISESSAVGGICGTNESSATIKTCYVTERSKVDANLNSIPDNKVQSKLEVRYGMAGGIAAVNKGTVSDCGYTDKLFYLSDEHTFLQTEDTKDITTDMNLMLQVKAPLTNVTSTTTNTARDGVNDLYTLFIDPDTGELSQTIKDQCGYLTDDKASYKYALPKGEYDASKNSFILSMSEGKGSIGGVVGYNAASGSVKSCASGRWVVENYLPAVRYIATGGVIGYNTATGNNVSELMNLAYVRDELTFIPENALDAYGRVTANATNADLSLDNRFYYVGGVIGMQSTEKSSGWTLDKCINVGTVLNYYGNNAGGVVGRVCGTGGNVEYCYNYGMLMTGFTTEYKNGYSGTAGGIVSHYTDLKAGNTNNIMHCINYGTVGFPAQGLDYQTNIRKSKRGGAMANDTGGIVGEISAPQSKYLYTVNIVDCVNAKEARVYAYSTDSGIVGKVGCLFNEFVDGGTNFTVNCLFVNVDTCRNYSSNIWNCQNINGNDKLLSKNVAGIYSGRDKYDPNTKVPRLGYTTIQNCFSVNLGQGFSNDNLKNVIEYNNGDIGHILGYSEDNSEKSTGITEYKNGRIAAEKNKTPDESILTYRYCGNNFFIDEVSFQYNNYQGLLKESGFDSSATKDLNHLKYARRVCAFVAENAAEAPTDSITPVEFEATEHRNAIQVAADENRVDKLSYRIGALRVISVAYGSEKNKFALVQVPYMYDIYKLNTHNTWVSGNKLHIKTAYGEYETDIIYKFTEKGSASPYTVGTNGNLNHTVFDKLLKTGALAPDKKSRLPYADEYDMDYTELDNAFVAYVTKLKKDRQPDKVKNVKVAESTLSGNYNVTWEIDGTGSLANRFYVRLKFYSFPSDMVIDKNKFESDTDNYDSYLVPESDKLANPQTLTSNGTTATFVTPGGLPETEGYTNYVVAQVCDAKAIDDGLGDTYYSRIDENPNCYTALKKKLPTPEYEIVSYKGEWVLHLKNAEDFEGYVGLKNFKAGAYALNGSNIDNNRNVWMTVNNIEESLGGKAKSELLNNTVDATKLAKGEANLKLYGYVTADGCLDSDLYEFTVYIPTSADPEFEYGVTDVERKLSKGTKPTYSGKLSYTAYVETAPVDQRFRLELYGIKKDSSGKETYETLAVKNYDRSISDAETDISIGYYDVRRDINLRNYDSFGVACWPASTSKDETVNYFFETSEENAVGKARASGFITDISEAETHYYYHLVTSNEVDRNIKITVEGDTFNWTMDKSYYGTAAPCDLIIEVYAIPKESAKDAMTAEEIKAISADPAYTYTAEGIGSYEVLRKQTETYDWANNRYYALIKVRDQASSDDADYVASDDAAMLDLPLPDPVIDVYTLGYGKDFVVLKNHDEFEEYFVKYPEYKDITTVTVTVEEREYSPFTISFDSSTWPHTHDVATEIAVPYSAIMRKRNNTGNRKTDGSKVNITATVAAKKDDVVINTNATDFDGNVYMPGKTEPVPSGLEYKFGNANARPTFERDSETGKLRVKYNNTMKIICTETAPQIDSFGFSFVVTGEPIADNGNKTKAVILARKDDAFRLSIGDDLKTVDLSMDIDDSVDFADYKNIRVCFWLTQNGDYDDRMLYHMFELSSTDYEKYRKTVDGVVLDLSSGSEEYLFVRYYCNTNEYIVSGDTQAAKGNKRGYYHFRIDPATIPN